MLPATTAAQIARLEAAGYPWTAALTTVLASLVIVVVFPFVVFPFALIVLAWRKLKS
jgi:hypothetical protein